MFDGNLVGTIDVAELAFYAFVLFFVGLIFWLRREDRREGYPLESELTGAVQSNGSSLYAGKQKFFHLPFDRGTVTPGKPRDPVDIAARKTERSAGAPFVPDGNPMTSGLGPAAYAQRAKWPDQDAHGRARIVPMSAEPTIGVAKSRLSRDPRGMKVVAADGKVAGTVTEIWVDRAEHLVRYLQIDTGTGWALAPMMTAVVHPGHVEIDAINAADFAGIPGLVADGEITRDEEERIQAYFGGGYLYANAGRQEPWL